MATTRSPVTPGDDALHGGLGNDQLVGGTGEDTLFGSFGNDVITGHEADADGTLRDDDTRDFVNGGAGDDTLVGGNGDILSGGDGADRFVVDITGSDDTAEPDPVSMRLTDYDAEEDQLMLLTDLDQDTGTEPDIQIVQDDETPGLNHIIINGQEVASVMGGTDLQAEDIELVRDAAALGLRTG